MSWLSSLWNALRSVFGFFGTDKGKQTLKTIAQLAEQAAPVVQALNILCPNKTFAEVAAAYQTYAVPFAQQMTSDPALIGNYMLNLATELLRKRFPESTTLLNSAIQLALVAVNRKEPKAA